jgi:hypothetical protein
MKKIWLGGIFFLLCTIAFSQNTKHGTNVPQEGKTVPRKSPSGPADSRRPDGGNRGIAVQAGVWLSGILHDKTDEAWFTFTPAANEILAAETDGAVDTVMKLYDGAVLLAANDDWDEENSNSRIEYLVESGVTYTIGISGFESDGPYRFRITMEALPADKTEPNDTQNQASPLSLGSRITAYLQKPGDVDWYTLKAPQKGLLILRTEGSLDTQMELYDARGNLTGQDDDSGSDNNAFIIAAVSQDVYYIKINGMGNTAGRYYLSAQFREPVKPDRYEDDDELDRAKEIAPGFSQERNFTLPDDRDWVRLRIVRKGTYTIEAQGHSASLDTILELFDRNGDAIASDDDGGENLSAKLMVNLSPGIYFIKVSTTIYNKLEETSYTLSVR